MKNRLVLSTALLMLAAALPAGAQGLTRTVRVHTADLDLSSNSGRTVLAARVAHAVDQVCGSAHNRSTAELANRADCAASVQDRVAPQLTAALAAAASRPQLASAPNSHAVH